MRMKSKKWDRMLKSIAETKGSHYYYLIINRDMSEFKKYLKDIQYDAYPVLFEGDGEISTIVQTFQEKRKQYYVHTRFGKG